MEVWGSACAFDGVNRFDDGPADREDEFEAGELEEDFDLLGRGSDGDSSLSLADDREQIDEGVEARGVEVLDVLEVEHEVSHAGCRLEQRTELVVDLVGHEGVEIGRDDGDDQGLAEHGVCDEPAVRGRNTGDRAGRFERTGIGVAGVNAKEFPQVPQHRWNATHRVVRGRKRAASAARTGWNQGRGCVGGKTARSSPRSGRARP